LRKLQQPTRKRTQLPNSASRGPPRAPPVLYATLYGLNSASDFAISAVSLPRFFA
jgi:hypothetical protein